MFIAPPETYLLPVPRVKPIIAITRCLHPLRPRTEHVQLNEPITESGTQICVDVVVTDINYGPVIPFPMVVGPVAVLAVKLVHPASHNANQVRPSESKATPSTLGIKVHDHRVDELGRPGQNRVYAPLIRGRWYPGPGSQVHR